MGKIDEACRIAVVVPCYNEALTVAKVVTDFRRELPEATVYVFDNNSTDGTGELAREAGAVVIRSPRQGKGHVIRHMSEALDADYYVLVDGDDTYPAEAARPMIEKTLAEGLDMLVAARLEQARHGAFRRFHRFGNQLISGLIALLFHAPITDVLSGYRVLSRKSVALMSLRGGGFEVETEMTLQALAKDLAMGEVAFPYRERPEGSHSKLSTWSDGFLILRAIILLFKDYKPLLFFTGVAVVAAVLSLISGSAPIIEFIRTGLVLHIPRAILASALAIIAMISLTVGLILDTVSKFHAEEVELWKRHLMVEKDNRGSFVRSPGSDRSDG